MFKSINIICFNERHIYVKNVYIFENVHRKNGLCIHVIILVFRVFQADKNCRITPEFTANTALLPDILFVLVYDIQQIAFRVC